MKELMTSPYFGVGLSVVAFWIGEKDMYEALKKDIQKFDDNKNFISSYIVEEDEQVEYAQVDGKDEATLIASVLQTSKKSKTTES